MGCLSVFSLLKSRPEKYDLLHLIPVRQRPPKRVTRRPAFICIHSPRSVSRTTTDGPPRERGDPRPYPHRHQLRHPAGSRRRHLVSDAFHTLKPLLETPIKKITIYRQTFDVFKISRISRIDGQGITQAYQNRYQERLKLAYCLGTQFPKKTGSCLGIPPFEIR